MTAPIFPTAITRTKINRRLREACDRISHTKGAQVRLLRHVWIAIEAAEAVALAEQARRGAAT